MSSSIDTEPKPKLIYVGDPMCSWCYGIAEELNATVAHYGDQVELELIMGGLRAGGGQAWNKEFKDFLKHHWEDVGIRSGQPFKFDILERADFDYDTEPACRAVVAAMEIDSAIGLPFFKRVQIGFYLENEDPKDVEFYKSICSDLGVNYDEFASKFESTEMREETGMHFYRSQSLGVRSFPTIAIEHKGQVHLVASGYSTFDKMKDRIDRILAQ